MRTLFEQRPLFFRDAAIDEGCARKDEKLSGHLQIYPILSLIITLLYAN